MLNAPVLLVEDDENDVIFLRSAWKKTEVLNALQVATDGEKAIDYLQGANEFADRLTHPMPCLVLLDLNLPCRTGFEVLEWIRQNPIYYYLPVVVLTSSSSEADARRAFQLGANSYITKPSNPEKLREFVLALKLYWLTWNFSPPGSEGAAPFVRTAVGQAALRTL